MKPTWMWSVTFDLENRSRSNVLFYIVRKMWSLTFYGVIRPLAKNLVSESSRKPCMLHEWKFIYKIFSWRHCAFVLRVQWTLRELLPLKLYNFYIKIYNSKYICRKDTKQTGMCSVMFDLEMGQGQNHCIFPPK
jgi:hypothetical protein